MIEINEPIILANKQIIKFSRFEMRKEYEFGKELYSAYIDVVVFDENGKYIKGDSVRIEADEWNEFWKNFNSGTFLLDVFVKKKGLEVIVPDSEKDFENKEGI